MESLRLHIALDPKILRHHQVLALNHLGPEVYLHIAVAVRPLEALLRVLEDRNPQHRPDDALALSPLGPELSLDIRQSVTPLLSKAVHHRQRYQQDRAGEGHQPEAPWKTSTDRAE